MNTYGIWKTDLIIENTHFGFLYIITNNISGQQYIGKKNFKTKAGKDSNWLTYMSSSKYLLRDISLLGKDSFSFQIVELHKSDDDLSLAEYNLQVSNDVLRAALPNGLNKFYNKNIRGAKFNTTGVSRTLSAQEREQISKRQSGAGNSFYGKKHSEEHKAKHGQAIIEYYKTNPHPAYGKAQSLESNQKRKESLKLRPKAVKGIEPPNKGKVSPRIGKPKCRKVSANSVIFNSVKECAEFFSISENSARHRFKSPQFESWLYLTD